MKTPILIIIALHTIIYAAAFAFILEKTGAML